MAREMQRWAAVAVLGAGLVVGACGGGGGSDKAKSAGGGAPGPEKTALETPAGPKLEVSAKEFAFTPSALSMKAGQATDIVLHNAGSIEHDFSVPDVGFKLSMPPSETGDLALTIAKPGTYPFHCSVPGHEGAGMKGTITVE
ncbi:MAG TPA: cupredoxin domain-containing protein [Acidimicrobiia bacterium]|nr:cupredoxin domain-containing protein [Acidimicrobiia bacterium]